jgi:hypothetical protein
MKRMSDAGPLYALIILVVIAGALVALLWKVFAHG